MPDDLPADMSEWRLYFCIVGELWQAVRDKQQPSLVDSYLDELEALSLSTDQDLLYRHCQRILNIARSAAYRGTGQ